MPPRPRAAPSCSPSFRQSCTTTSSRNGPRRSSTSSPGWLVLVKTQPPVALAFERLDGHMRVARETISPAAHAPGDQAPVRETLREAEAMRGVLHLPAILETIKDRAHRASPTKRG